MTGDCDVDFATERAQLLEEGNRLDAARGNGPRSERAMDLWRRYRQLLPEVTVARCPHGGGLLRWFMDPLGLDGWAWEYSVVGKQPVDPPPLWLCMNGAMRLVPPLENTKQFVRPGPGVPYVVPRILRCPDVRAVISQVSVGAHTGWVISYFGPKPKGVTLVNNWGKHEHYVYDDTGKWRGWNSDEKDQRTGQYDFELAPWLRPGKLLWIAPGDESATLREGIDDCPYVDLPGHRRCQDVFRRKVSRVGEPEWQDF